MAAKSHIRNSRPVVICLATNDALAGSARNIGTLLNSRNYYFVPFGQDNYKTKPTSLVADFAQIPQTLELAMKKTQLQPILLT
jgi:dipicolinate synthase subunit B